MYLKKSKNLNTGSTTKITTVHSLNLSVYQQNEKKVNRWSYKHNPLKTQTKTLQRLPPTDNKLAGKLTTARTYLCAKGGV